MVVNDDDNDDHGRVSGCVLVLMVFGVIMVVMVVLLVP